jgi:hypothetical protein
MIVINPQYNSLLNNIYLYIPITEDSKNIIETESSNKTENNLMEEDNIETVNDNNTTKNNLPNEREKVNYHILVAFSSVKKIYTHSHQSFYNIIGSSVFTTSDIDLVFENIKNNNLISERLRLLNGKSITLCVIIPGLKSDRMEQIKINDSIDIDFNLIKMSEDYFFDDKNLNEFKKYEFSSKNAFFFFKETS